MDAAAKAARFERPMLASSNMRVINGFEDLTREELERLAAAEETVPDLIGSVALRTIHDKAGTRLVRSQWPEDFACSLSYAQSSAV
jgi:hypothetical protein